MVNRQDHTLEGLMAQATAATEAAGVLRRQVLALLAQRFGGHPLEQLEYEACVSTATKDVLRQEEATLLSTTVRSAMLCCACCACTVHLVRPASSLQSRAC